MSVNCRSVLTEAGRCLCKIMQFLLCYHYLCWQQLSMGRIMSGICQCSRIRILCFFQISKKHDFLRFFEMMYQKVVKSR